MVVRLDNFKTDVATALVGLPGMAARFWDGGAIVENLTYTLIPFAPYPLRIVELVHSSGGSGMSFTAAVSNAGTVVGGLNAVSVTQGITPTTATGNQLVALGGLVTVAITAVAGSPTGARLILRFTRA